MMVRLEESKAIATGLLSEIIDIPEIVSLKEIDLGTVYDGEKCCYQMWYKLHTVMVR